MFKFESKIKNNMAIITKPYFDFFEELAHNNNRDWFLANKKRYEKDAKEPFLRLVEAIVAALDSTEPDLSLIPSKQMLFRINRDVRFSKDKRPYKEHLSASLARFGTKDKLYPGHYLQLSAGESMMAGGAYFFEEKPMLNKVRQFIADNPERFTELIDNQAFKSKWGTIRGEKNKRLPNSDLMEAAEFQPIIFNNQFYWSANLTAEMALKDNFPDVLASYFEAAQPLNEFLKEAMY